MARGSHVGQMNSGFDSNTDVAGRYGVDALLVLRGTVRESIHGALAQFIQANNAPVPEDVPDTMARAS